MTALRAVSQTPRHIWGRAALAVLLLLAGMIVPGCMLAVAAGAGAGAGFIAASSAQGDEDPTNADDRAHTK